jgi:hypothetical protein
MQTDIRNPIGLMFAVIGVLLLVADATATPEQRARALGTNLAPWWGLVLVVVAAAMLGLARRARR